MNSDDIQIVPMITDAEIDGKAYVHWKSWQETYTGLIDQTHLDGITLEKCIQMAHRWKDNILVAKDGERVVGFVAYGAYRDSTLPNVGEVFAIYVLQDYQGKKVGYRLMKSAIEKLATYPKIAVWVLKGNTKAIEFYEKYGFRFDGVEMNVLMGSANTELRMILNKG